MEIPGNWEVAGVSRRRQFALVSGSCLILALSIGESMRGDASATQAAPTFQQYCYQCHGEAASGGLNLQELSSQDSLGRNFREWEKVAAALEQKRMPPPGMPQPSDADRERAVASIRNGLREYVVKHAGDPGRVTLRRLTSSEYAYNIEDLTGLKLDVDQEFAGDAVGGEGFTNYGDVQFMQDATMERYLETAKRIADHAVIGAGPLSFYEHPGKTGFEMGALARVNEIHAANGFRTVSGEGGRPFGLERYGKALYAAWRYRHRVALGESDVTLKDLAKREGINARFAEHIWSVLNKDSLGHPSSEVAARWRSLPAPEGGSKVAEEAVRAGCEKIQTFLATWPSWLFARGDVAAGGAGDESPLVFSDATLKAEPTRRFQYPLGERFPRRGRPPADPNAPIRVYLHIASVNPKAEKPVVIWRNPTLVSGLPARRRRGGVVADVTGPGAVPPAVAASTPEIGEAAVTPPTSKPLRAVLSEEDASRLSFGKSPDGTEIGENEFATTGSVFFDIPAEPAAGRRQFEVTAEIGSDRNAVFRLILSNREDGGASRGAPTRALLGDPGSEGYESFKAGVMELATLWPPNGQGEANPSDKDPVPEPFDNTYNTPEHDAFVLKVKYQRNDQYLMEYVLDEPVKVQLDQAWNDLFASFDYHDQYLGMLASKYKLDLNGKRMADLTAADIEALPAEPRKYVQPLRAHYEQVMSAQVAAQPGHIEDAIEFASRAWRRPLTAQEKDGLRAYYRQLREAGELDHVAAMRAMLARTLVSPSFLYRTEQVAGESPLKPLSGWELASRLSYFLWSSTPDHELRRAAAAGELNNPEQLRSQAKRMLADPKARRMATEFFGQWLGFYRFDEYRGVDTSRFPEFTEEVKSAMYDEAVSFFEYILRNGRPVREILHADYTFLNQALAKYYGVSKEVASNGRAEIVQGANEFKRGGLLRFGAVLTATSAPLRTSPVKRGDWILRRVLGTPVPPPPADAGSLPADDKNFGEMTLREKLESHKRNPTCAACHTRIDPLGFPLEHYDAVGRWRDQYHDGKPIEDSGELSDKTPVAGLDGLLAYMKAQENQILKTMSHKLLGYSLGRTVQASDQPLVERMVEAGSDASFSELVSEIVASRQFRFRLGREQAAPSVAGNKSGSETLVARDGPAAKKLAQVGAQ